MKKFIALPSLALLAFTQLTIASTTATTPAIETLPVTDGPYLFEQTDRGAPRTAYWICSDKLRTTQVQGLRLVSPDNCGALPQPTLNPKAFDVSTNTYSDIKKVVALSDVHGQYDILITLLRNQNIIDKDNNWAFGDGHMVMTGDMFDRGHQVNEVLWFMYQLDQQAIEAGGKLHLLMGNHEQMVMRGDLRYVHERYQVAAKLLERSYDELYDKSSEIGQWLRAKHTLVKINDTLFLHGGISGEWLDRGLTLDVANDLYRKNIDRSKPELKQDDLLNFLFFGNGPTWYRGYFKPGYDEAELDKILSYFDVKHIVVGHTSQERVLGLYNNKVIAVDSSIKEGLSGELLLMEDNTLTRGLYNGSRIAL
ncbi:metallophosphoesterase [Shewanella sediminis HAW-EB3]|uniref:Metallophosphoesterase n=1 Tax=Shewanella sediminis (strain HAW-EB3) TaxID=425104 RepID=A8FSQ7_SHESH|nr:metallophosphoesterase [Shewanella sediminis]ABV35880.1 metallophosphoesterase [Shewanella sediminis HAW-EB3]